MIKELLKFLDASKTKFQAISQTKEILLNNGFKELGEDENYKEYNKFFVVRNNSSIIAISIPENFKDNSLNIFHYLLRLYKWSYRAPRLCFS